MIDYLDCRSEDELAERLAKKIIFGLEHPCKLIEKSINVIVMGKGYTITIKPTKENGSG